MKKEYVTPPYSDAFKKVCNSLDKKIDSIIKVQVESGLNEEESKKNVIPLLTKDIKISDEIKPL